MKKTLAYFAASLMLTALFASGLAYACLRINRRGWAADPLVRHRQIVAVFVVLAIILVVAEINRILNSKRARPSNDAPDAGNVYRQFDESDQATRG